MTGARPLSDPSEAMRGVWHIVRCVVLVAYVLFVVILAAATFVEWRCGTAFVSRYFYGAPWFTVLMAVLVSSGLALAIKLLGRNRTALLLHSSLALIALGAFLTHVTSHEGILHLREGGDAQTRYLSSAEGHPLLTLPTDIALDSFRIVYYSHTDAPQDYISYLRIDTMRATVSMNRILSLDGYRFYQSSYDPDMRGTILTVNHDPYGTPVTYAGYAMLFLSLILVLVNPHGRFRRLLSSKSAIVVLGVILVYPLTSCSAPELPAAPIPTDAQSDKFSQLDIIYHDRPAPIDTYCADFAMKVTGHTTWHTLSANTIVLAWMTAPSEWQNVAMIKVKYPDAAQQMGLTPVDGYVSAASLFAPDGHYLLTPYLEQRAKAAIDINDRLQAIISLTDGSAFSLAPAPIPPLRRQLEVMYVRLQPVALLFKIQLALGLVAIVLAVWKGEGRGRVRWGGVLLRGIAILCAALQTVALAVRGVIACAWPLANGYETMLFLALALCVASLFLVRRHVLLAAACLLMSGFALLVAHIAISNPHITPLMPVLHSPWLSLHVASVMIAYALFTIIALNSVIALVNGRHLPAMRISLILLYVAVVLLAIGIFIGAVWAGQSWGRYWGWDPKEVWALITLLVYVVPLHPSLFRTSSARAVHVYLLVAFAAVIMTYFGVNYLLGGMHGYA